MPPKTEVFRTFFINDEKVWETIVKTTKPGNKWTMEATASFSTSQKISYGFGKAGTRNIQLRVKTNRGTWVDPISDNQGELEHIMMNGEKFRVVEVNPFHLQRKHLRDKSGIEIVLEEI